MEDLNRFLGGWAAFFRYGNSAARFDKISELRADAAGAVHQQAPPPQPRVRRWVVIAFQSPNQLGLITLSGIVVAPRPFRDWRGKPNAGGERRR